MCTRCQRVSNDMATQSSRLGNPREVQPGGCERGITYRLIRGTLISWNYVIYVALTALFLRQRLAGVSIFTLKEVQLQRDPGYRNASYPESGEG